MRWLVVWLAACGFSKGIGNVMPDDGSPGGEPQMIDAAIDGVSPVGCRAAEIESMSAQTCVRRNDGEVWCWGRNADGAIGVPSQTTCMAGDGCVRKPTKLPFTEPILRLGLGDKHSCAMSALKTYCWGLNNSGQFGDNTTTSAVAPKEIALRAGAKALRGGDLHSCSLSATGISCSGRNNFGEVGDMSTTERDAPTPIVIPGTPNVIGGGFHHSCAISGGSVYCWGQNNSAQVDTTGNTPVTAPRTSGVTNATAITGGSAHTCARIDDGSLRCWGANGNGQLGVGNTMGQTGPQTPTISGVSQIASGANHTCALAGTGVWCWGEGFTTGPTQVNFGGAQALAVSAGSSHDCAIMTNGTVRCWGTNGYGQLGNNSTTSSSTPVEAVVCP